MTDRGAPPPEDPGRSPLCAWGILCAEMPELTRAGHLAACDDSSYWLARRDGRVFGYWLCRFHAEVAREYGLSVTEPSTYEVRNPETDRVEALLPEPERLLADIKAQTWAAVARGEVPPHRWDGLGAGGLPMACQFPGCTAAPGDRVHLRLSTRQRPSTMAQAMTHRDAGLVAEFLDRLDTGPRVEPEPMPPLFKPEDRPRGLVAPVVAYSILTAVLGLAVVGEAHRAVQAVLARRRLIRVLRDAGLIE